MRKTFLIQIFEYTIFFLQPMMYYTVVWFIKVMKDYSRLDIQYVSANIEMQEVIKLGRF